jgi:hypothetical protein
VVSFKKSDKKFVDPNLTFIPSLVAKASNKEPFQKPVRYAFCLADDVCLVQELSYFQRPLEAPAITSRFGFNEI